MVYSHQRTVKDSSSLEAVMMFGVRACDGGFPVSAEEAGQCPFMMVVCHQTQLFPQSGIFLLWFQRLSIFAIMLIILRVC